MTSKAETVVKDTQISLTGNSTTRAEVCYDWREIPVYLSLVDFPGYHDSGGRASFTLTTFSEEILGNKDSQWKLQKLSHSGPKKRNLYILQGKNK